MWRQQRQKKKQNRKETLFLWSDDRWAWVRCACLTGRPGTPIVVSNVWSCVCVVVRPIENVCSRAPVKVKESRHPVSRAMASRIIDTTPCHAKWQHASVASKHYWYVFGGRLCVLWLADGITLCCVIVGRFVVFLLLLLSITSQLLNRIILAHGEWNGNMRTWGIVHCTVSESQWWIDWRRKGRIGRVVQPDCLHLIDDTQYDIPRERSVMHHVSTVTKCHNDNEMWHFYQKTSEPARISKKCHEFRTIVTNTWRIAADCNNLA